MASQRQSRRTLCILLVEDNPGDVKLVREVLKPLAGRRIDVCEDGLQAMRFLRRQPPYASAARPDLILLDLNLPHMSGRDVLRAIKNDDELASIPVVVLSSSSSPDDVLYTYRMHGNCYVSKPMDFESYSRALRLIEQFWLTTVELPHSEDDD